MSSDEDGDQLMAAFKSAGARKAAPSAQRSSPSAEDSGSENTLGSKQDRPQVQAPSQSRRAVCVRVKPANRKEEFVYYEAKAEVEEIGNAQQRAGSIGAANAGAMNVQT